MRSHNWLAVPALPAGLSVFGPFWKILGSFWMIVGQFWMILGSYLMIFGWFGLIGDDKEGNKWHEFQNNG